MPPVVLYGRQLKIKKTPVFSSPNGGDAQAIPFTQINISVMVTESAGRRELDSCNGLDAHHNSPGLLGDLNFTGNPGKKHPFLAKVLYTTSKFKTHITFEKLVEHSQDRGQPLTIVPPTIQRRIRQSSTSKIKLALAGGSSTDKTNPSCDGAQTQDTG